MTHMTQRFIPTYFEKDFSINHAEYALNQSMPAHHYHDFYEIYIYLGEEMTYFINDRPYPISKNQIVFINKNIYHKTNYFGNNKKERILIIFTENFLNIYPDESIRMQIKELFSFPVISFSQQHCKEICDILLLKILHLYKEEDLSKKNLLRAKFLLADLLLYLTDFRENAVSNCIDIPLSPVEKRISDIVSFINNNYAANITLDILCSKFFINKYYLCHIFKKIIGISIVDFINQKRIAEAEKLIRHTTHSITDISCMAGFNNTNYFINLFKKKNGVTPKVYRETSVISIL